MTMRGRFAPSPTGAMHLGNARTALLAWLQARRAGGTMLLRIEDIDQPRCIPGMADEIMRDMAWLGLDWDEGPVYQSARKPAYMRALRQLLAGGHLFKCYCSRKDIALAASAPHPGEEGPRYPGTCRSLSQEEEVDLLAKGRRPAMRFRVEPGVVAWDDLVHGRVERDPSREVGDFAVMRSDGNFAYHLAVTVDDGEQGVTHVLRGDDLLSSTARQILLYRALGMESPAFAHVPLLLGPDGQRLSKRHGAISVAALRERGADPQAVTGYLAHLSGLLPPGERCRPLDLIAAFDLEEVPKHAVACDPAAIPLA